MNKNAGSMLVLLLSANLIGCHADTPKASPVPPITQTPTKTTTTPIPQGCAALIDPAKVEDCRFRAEVLKKRQASKASPVVKHAPGTIQQP